MLRHLVIIVLLGAALVAGRRMLFAHAAEAPSLVVSVASSADEATVVEAVETAVLVDSAVRSGFARSDPMVRERLLRNMRFVGEGGDDAFAQALALGMHESDPVVRQRLAERTREVLAGRVVSRDVDDITLAAHARAHPARFTRAELFSLTHVFLSREHRGSSLQQDARQLGIDLAGVSRLDGAKRSDSWIHPRRLERVPARRLDGQLGAGFSAALERAPLHAWFGPLPSSFGLHFVWLEAREPAELPPLAAIRAAVLHDYQQVARRAALRAGVERLRNSYRIVVERRP